VIAAIVGGLRPTVIIANNFFLVSALISGSSVTYLIEKLFRMYYLSERDLLRERETLARQHLIDDRYLKWLKQLASFLRHEVRQPIAQISSSIEIVQLACKDNAQILPYLASATTGARHVWNLVERASRATDAEAFVRQSKPEPAALSVLLAEQVALHERSQS